MNEDFLQFLWQYKNFIQSDLKTTDGLPIEIIKTGAHNTNAGPDFLNARVKIGDKTWAGSVEIHLKASDWLKHGHSGDDAYKNVILHVVFDDDLPGSPDIPCLELKQLIYPESLAQYLQLKNNRDWVPCAAQIKEVDYFIKQIWLDRMVAERIEQKSVIFLELLKKNNNDWAESFYQFLGKNFGFKINNDAFESLACSLPQKLLSKHRNNLTQIEALLYGQAGMLNQDFEDDYPKFLKKEFDFLSKKYNLNPIPYHQWNYLRLRPPNFPTIRISQFASLAFKSTHLFSQILEINTLDELTKLFNVTASGYWDDHFVWDKKTKTKSVKKIGLDSINNIAINTIVPVLFAYGMAKNLVIFKDKALRLLEEIPPEKNNITNGWSELGLKNENAYTSQALIHLKNNYCNNKFCLHCAIGTKILKKNNF